MQRLLAPVCAADWKVFHAPEGSFHISNDLWLGPAFSNRQDGSRSYGWLVPLSHSCLLALLPQPGRDVLFLNRGPLVNTWIANIEHYEETPDHVHERNRVIAASCRDLILGPTDDAVMQYASETSETATWDDTTADRDLLDGWGQIPSRNLREHEFDWHRLVTIASAPVQRRSVIDLDRIDWDAIDAAGWFGPTYIGANTGIRQSGLTVTSGRCAVRLDLRIAPDSSPTGPADNWFVAPEYGPGSHQTGWSRTVNVELTDRLDPADLVPDWSSLLYRARPFGLGSGSSSDREQLPVST